MGLLSFLLLIPLAGTLFLLLVPNTFDKAIKTASMVFSLAAFAVSIFILTAFDSNTFHFQFMESVPFLPQFGITYQLGIDGISVWLLALTTFLTFIANWFSFYITERVKTYFVCIQLLQLAMLGVFVSLDLVLFYTFFEASLVPMYFLINIWGGSKRKYASAKFFIYTFSASVFMLVGLIALGLQMRSTTGQMSFDLIAIQEQVALGKLWTGALQLQTLVFWAFTVAFAVKCPLFPVHTWLPDAHTEAPTAGSVILAGVLLKMGTYAFLRFCIPLFPEAMRAAIPWLIAISVVGIIYGAIVAAMQDDVKKLVAYSSVAHMGFVMLGICSLTHNGMVGGAFQQLNHGVSTGALFLLIGLLYERTHTRAFKDMGGLKAQMPIFSALFLIVMFSSVGLPGTNGFIGEFLALLGAFQVGHAGAFGVSMIWPVLAATGVVFAAVYLLTMFMKVFYGPITNPMIKTLRDIKPHETAMVGTFIVLIFWGGIYPNTFMKPMEKAIGATRMMALNEEGKRPMWAEPTLEIAGNGDLVRIAPRTEDQPLGDYQIVEVIAPANFYFENEQSRGTEVARR